MSTLLKNKIINELNAINWSNDDATVNSDKAFLAIITGIYDYINENYTITGTYVGTHLLPTPQPIFGTTTHLLSIVNTTWLNTYKNVVRNGIDSNGIQRIFTGIQSMLAGTVFATLESTTGTPKIIDATILPVITIPVVPVVFPSISTFGNPCQTEILGSKPSTKELFWEILARYIQNALNINIIPPIPFSGVIASPATAITNSTMVFL